MNDISIIIVNYNGLGFIEDCLASIKEALFSGRESIACEVIIVDNASSDRSPEYIDDFCSGNKGFRIIRNSRNRGFAAASNKGVGMAAGRFLLFLNPDCRLLERGLAGVLDFYKNAKDAGILGVRILNKDGSLQYSCRAFPTLARQFYESFFCYRILSSSRIFGSYFMTWWDHLTSMSVDWLSGSFLLVDRKIFREAGGFDEDYFMYSEDTQLCLEISGKGYRNYYYPYFTVEHADAGIASRDMTSREAHIWRSRRLYFEKNYSRIHASVFSFIYLCGIVNRIIVFALGSVFVSAARKRLRIHMRIPGMYFKNKDHHRQVDR